ncbi:MAG: LamG-like jellyroll fold domain-containing protein, partial [Ferruginibacter sp.]
FLYSRHFALYDQSRLCKAGLQPGSTISKIAWFKDGGGSAPGATHDFRVYMKNTNTQSMNGDVWSELIKGATLVYEELAGTVIPTTSGWWELTLSTPFVYTGKAIEVYTDWFCGGGPNGNRTNGLIAFSITRGSSNGDLVSGGTGKRTPFSDDEFVGGNQFTGNSTPDLLTVKFTQAGGTPKTEICGNGIDDDCDGQIDEGCPAHYESRTTGSWNFPSSWLRFVNNLGWLNTLIPPTHTDLTVRIVSPDIITLNSTASIDQMTIADNAKLRLSIPGALMLNNGAGDDLINNGFLEMLQNTHIDGPGNIINNKQITLNTAKLNAPLINNKNIFFTNDCTIGPLQNEGGVFWQSGLLASDQLLNNNSAGTFIINSNTIGSFSIDNKGTMNKASTGVTNITGSVHNSGIITGHGTLTFSGSFNNTGTIAPGQGGVGMLRFNSPHPFSSTSTLSCEIISAAGAGIGNDLLVRDLGNLALQGNLVVTELANAPAGTYEIIRLNNGTISGTFNQVTLPAGYVLEIRENTVVVVKSLAITTFPGSGNGVRFDGINSLATIPHNNNFNFAINQDFTIDFWVKVPVENQADVSFTTNVILEKWGSPWGAYPFSIAIGNASSNFAGKIILSRDNGNGAFGSIAQTAINDGRYHHVAVQKAGALLKIYIDGILSSQVADRIT